MVSGSLEESGGDWVEDVESRSIGQSRRRRRRRGREAEELRSEWTGKRGPVAVCRKREG